MNNLVPNSVKSNEESCSGTVSFVKRAVLQSNDGGNSFQDQPLAQAEPPAETERESLYEQLSKTLRDKRQSKLEGKPEEYVLEDQEFLHQVMKHKHDTVVRHAEQDGLEFQRQKLLLKSKSQGPSSSSLHTVSHHHPPQLAEESIPVVIQKRKKVKLTNETTSTKS